MASDSLKVLETSFRQWRRSKRHATEPVPAALERQVQRAAATHGIREVAKVTGSVGRRIVGRRPGSGRKRTMLRQRPTFSRIQVRAPESGAGFRAPLAEAETPQGLKLRIYSTAPEALGLIRELVSTQVEVDHAPGAR
jgi:hypothetical protein